MEALGTPLEFGAFPYGAPYPIQVQLMRAVYEAIETRKVAVLESPTGTGKSLSVLCSALQWIEDNAARRPASAPTTATTTTAAAAADDDDEPDWMRSYVPPPSRADLTVVPLPPPIGPPPQQQAAAPGFASRVFKKPRVDPSNDAVASNSDDLDDSDFVIEPVEDADADVDAAAGSFAAGEKFVMPDVDGNIPDDEDGPHVQKVYYCSRTHSQLAQFLGELKRTRFAESISVVSLGSRKNLCINDAVNRTGRSATRVNEICLDLQAKDSKKKKCQFIEKARQPSLVYALRTAVLDVEEAAAMGRQHSSCPYYATRSSVPIAQLVTLPYQMLLHKRTRASLGIKLIDQIVVIDEAHNLIDTVTELHSAGLSLSQASDSLAHLKRYIQRYRSRLLSSNLISLKLLERVLQAFVARLTKSSSGSEELVLGLHDFWTQFQSNIDQVNLFQMCRFLEQSKLARKLHGFIDHADTKGVAIHSSSVPAADPTDEHSNIRPASPMHAVEAFLMALTNRDKDGRVMVQKDSFKYILLNPAGAFEEIVREARAVLLLGGTMKPLSEFRSLLFPQVGSGTFSSFECGHVVPASSVLCLAINQGPSNVSLQFVLDSRGNARLMDEVGESLVQLASKIPDGLVVFFQKFDYVEQLLERWRSTGTYARLQAIKHVYSEPRSAAAVEATLASYSASIDSGSGAMILCVVNGKMSEGINFKDRMGRGVVVVGLPYANKYAPALKAKIDFLNGLQQQQGDEYYENLCMKAVNQSIGRAIRHKDDYAVIVLLDRRFSEKRAKLPGWIGNSFSANVAFPDAIARIGGFFSSRACVQTNKQK